MGNESENIKTMNKKYLNLLREKFPEKEDVLTEIINLSAICELPKGTEHFMSDLHGEFYAFNHVLRNGSGGIKEKIRECLPDLSTDKVNQLALLIYYPKEKIEQEIKTKNELEIKQWLHDQLLLLLTVANHAGNKYTRSKVHKALPTKFAYILEELLSEIDNSSEKEDYFNSIIGKVLSLGQMTPLIEALSTTIRRLTIDHLHVVGDIYDRGPYPDLIMDRLMTLPSVDIQWGNHDIVWMAIIAGSPLAMMNAIRICARYGNLDIIEERYGISLRPLIEYAQKYYQASPAFAPKLMTEDKARISDSEKILLAQLQQAAAVLQFKLESQLIKRRPEFELEHRDLLYFIDYENQQIMLEGQTYPLVDFQAPTISTENPAQLSTEEKEITDKLLHAFQASEKLQRHVDFLLEKGGMYLKYNGNLLIHGCIPLHSNGDFKSLRVNGQAYSGQDLMDYFDHQVRKSFKNPESSTDFATDLLWYLWVGESSSLFGKNAMTTFERYYIKDKLTHVEKKNAYYHLRNDSEIVKNLLSAFELPETGHIINGHTPVKEKDGENPIKAEGQLIVIDGGFSKPYQSTTGIAGYTLLNNSYGMQLVAHQPFNGISDAVKNGGDIVSVKRLVDVIPDRTKVRDTNIGQKLLEDIKDLEYLFSMDD